jgi:hypothetical protein
MGGYGVFQTPVILGGKPPELFGWSKLQHSGANQGFAGAASCTGAGFLNHSSISDLPVAF